VKKINKKKSKYILYIAFVAIIFFLVRFIIFETRCASWTTCAEIKIYTNTFNSIALPNDFILISSTWGINPNVGQNGLTRQYEIQGTREKVIEQISTALKAKGYTIVGSNYYSYHNLEAGFDEYDAENTNLQDSKTPKYFEIRLYPQNDIQNPNSSRPAEEVNEVEIEIDNEDTIN